LNLIGASSGFGFFLEEPGDVVVVVELVHGELELVVEDRLRVVRLKMMNEATYLKSRVITLHQISPADIAHSQMGYFVRLPIAFQCCYVSLQGSVGSLATEMVDVFVVKEEDTYLQLLRHSSLWR
jgi:hypothetical protein